MHDVAAPQGPSMTASPSGLSASVRPGWVGHQLEGAIGILVQLIKGAVEVLIVGAIEADDQSICKGCCGIVLWVHWSVVVRLQIQERF